MTWDNIYNGGAEGGVPQLWGVQGLPTIYVLDREGVIRALDKRGKALERFVDELVAAG